MFSSARFVVVMSLFIAMFTATALFVKGKLPVPSYVDLGFDAERAHAIHAFLASKPRYIGSHHYSQCISFILEEVEKAVQRGYDLTVEVSRGDFGICGPKTMCKFERNITNIVVKHKGNGNDVEPFILSAHVDSHPNTVASYDDGINVAVMLALATSEFVNNLSFPVHFVFLGSEEHGLHGSRLLMSNESTRISGNVLNLEAMGSHRPFALVSKARKSHAVMKAYSKVKGGIMASFFNDIATSPLFTSTSDIMIYDRHGVSGAQCVFLGNPAVYHTQYDSDLDIEDIRMQGNILQGVMLNYAPVQPEDDVIGFGICPLVVTVERHKFKRIALATSLVAVTMAMFFFSSWNCSRGLGITFFVLIVFAFLSAVVNKANTVSIARDQDFCFAVLAFLGCILVLMIEVHDGNDNGDGLLCYHILLYAVLLFVSRDLDVGIVFCLSLLPQIPMLFLRHALFRIPLVMAAMLPVTYTVAVTYGILIGYVTQIPYVFADLALMLLIALWSLSASFLALSVSFGGKPSSVLKKQLIELIGVLYILFTMLFVCLRELPYSKEYVIVGTESEIIYENGSSVISFIPLAKERVIDGIERNMIGFLDLDDDYQGYLHSRGPAYIDRLQNSSIGPWPEFEFDKEVTPDGNRKITFRAKHVPDDTDLITLVFKCKRQVCIESMQGFEQVDHKDSEFGRVLAVRIAPVESFLNFSFVALGVEEIETDILYMSSTLTAGRMRFRNILGDYVKHFAKDRFLGDTIRLSTRFV